MIKSKKIQAKVLSVTLALAAALTLPVGLQAQAANGASTDSYAYMALIDKSNPDDAKIYYLYRGSKGAINSAYEGATYDKDSNTLTLNNVEGNMTLETNMMGDDFKIKLEGNNTLLHLGSYGDGHGSSITLTGNGTLNISSTETFNNAISIYAEGTNASFTVEKGVTLNLASKESVIFINGSQTINDPTAITFQNGQDVTVKAEEATYEKDKTVPGLLIDPYGYGPDRRSLCTYQGETHWYAGTYGGYYVSANKVVHDEELSLYYTDPTSSTAAFNIQLTTEEFEAQCTDVSNEDVSVYSAESNSYGVSIGSDGDGNEYAIYSSWINGEQKTYAFDIMKDVTLADGNTYKLLLRNESVDASTLTTPTETIHTGTYNYSVDQTTLQITGQEEVPEVPTVVMYRLYNPNSGEHFYTASDEEKDTLVGYGWIYEGGAWNAPTSSETPVYRLYNPNAGDHHYTPSVEEREMLVSVGWNFEGISWYSDDSATVPLYRLYNPNALGAGAHHYTPSDEEKDMLTGYGWQYEGIGWYGR